MASGFPIGEILIGEDSVTVIAEIGINHGGNLETAKHLAKLAVESGADLVKTQTHLPELEMSLEAKERVPGNANKSIFDVISENSLPLNQEAELADYIRHIGGTYISTPFSREAADFLDEIGVQAFKIGSGECNNYPLVDHIAAKGKPVIMSTGMNDLASVGKSVEILRRRKAPFALLHTTNLYPTPARLIRLGSIAQLSNAFPEAVVGLSDHSKSNSACLAAVALGARVLERHFTDTKDREGPDIVCSMTPGELSELKVMSMEILMATGGDKGNISEEDVTRNFAFSSVAALVDIQPGQQLTTRHIFPIRPSGGDFGPADLDSLVGMTARRYIKARTQIRREDIQVEESSLHNRN